MTKNDAKPKNARLTYGEAISEQVRDMHNSVGKMRVALAMGPEYNL